MGGIGSGAHQRVLYEIIDLDDPLEIPVFIGTMSELCAYTGLNSRSILSIISHAKKSGRKCQYIRLGNEEEL